METTRLTFGIHSFDADAFGHLAPAALAGYLQEAAGRSADGLGFGLAALTRRGATWVLARQRVELDQPVRMGEVLEVETWPAGLDRLAALRDFRLWRDGIEIGRAATTWFVLTHLLGRYDVRVYDGSWAEWGLGAKNPVHRGRPVAD